MKILLLIYNLAIVLAIFSFVWGIIKLVLYFFNQGNRLNYGVSSAIKILQYFLIVSVCTVFAVEQASQVSFSFVITGLILFGYFISRMYSSQLQFVKIQVISSMTNRKIEKPNPKVEIAIITFSLLIFVLFSFFPIYAENGATEWFYRTILSIEKNGFFGVIFKIIAFFFAIALLRRLAKSIQLLINGDLFREPVLDSGETHNPFDQFFNQQNNNHHKKNDDDFDDYEEIR